MTPRAVLSYDPVTTTFSVLTWLEDPDDVAVLDPVSVSLIVYDQDMVSVVGTLVSSIPVDGVFKLSIVTLAFVPHRNYIARIRIVHGVTTWNRVFPFSTVGVIT